MGRQIQFYMLPQDCRTFLHFVQERDPVVVIPYCSKSPRLEEARLPWEGGWFCLWNQPLVPALQYEFIAESNVGPYYRIDDSLPVLEFTVATPEQWNERPALRPGRVYTGLSAKKGQRFEKWFNALSSWLRRNYISNPDRFLGGYVGPAVLEWFKQGGIFLPMIYPPVTPEWLAVFETQDRIRAALAKR